MANFSVVIISYNGREFLKKCLNAILKSSLKPSQVIVVDDFSSDGTEEMVKRDFKFVEFLRNEKNLGPTASRNKGAKLTNKGNIIFIDNDILVKSDTFENLVGFIEKNDDCGIAGAKVIPEGKEKMWWNMGYDPNNFRETLGYLFGFLFRFYPNSKKIKDYSMNFILNYWDYDKILPVGWVIESCFIVKKDLFDKIGGFDERFFMYYEGPDLCLRLRQQGFKVYFYPEAKVDVLEGHAHSKFERFNFLRKSKYLFYKKHYFYKKSNPIFFFIGKIISSIFYLLA